MINPTEFYKSLVNESRALLAEHAEVENLHRLAESTLAMADANLGTPATCALVDTLGGDDVVINALTSELAHGPAFWLVLRLEGESARQFILRAWRTANPRLPDDLDDVPIKAHSEIVIESGYASPYSFGCILRELAGYTPDDVETPIFRANGEQGERVYYAFSRNPGGVEFGPRLAAMYNPDKRPAHAIPAEIDFFDAVGFIADTSPSESER